MNECCTHHEKKRTKGKQKESDKDPLKDTVALEPFDRYYSRHDKGDDN